KMADADDVDGFFWLSLEFRDVEAQAAGNERLRQVLDSVGLQSLVVRHAGIALPGRLQTSVRQHEDLLRAYEARNEALAVAVMRTIVVGSLANVERAKWD